MANDLIHVHFCQAAEIWQAYYAGRLSVDKREALLRPLRAALRAIPLKA